MCNQVGVSPCLKTQPRFQPERPNPFGSAVVSIPADGAGLGVAAASEVPAGDDAGASPADCSSFEDFSTGCWSAAPFSAGSRRVSFVPVSAAGFSSLTRLTASLGSLFSNPVERSGTATKMADSGLPGDRASVCPIRKAAVG